MFLLPEICIQLQVLLCSKLHACHMQHVQELLLGVEAPGCMWCE